MLIKGVDCKGIKKSWYDSWVCTIGAGKKFLAPFASKTKITSSRRKKIYTNVKRIIDKCDGSQRGFNK